MKILTQTRDGGFVIETTPDEYRELCNLILAVEGKSFDETYNFEFKSGHLGEYRTTFDLSTVFGAIKAFYIQKFRVNDIQKGLDILKASLDERL